MIASRLPRSKTGAEDAHGGSGPEGKDDDRGFLKQSNIISVHHADGNDHSEYEADREDPGCVVAHGAPSAEKAESGKQDSCESSSTSSGDSGLDVKGAMRRGCVPGCR